MMIKSLVIIAFLLIIASLGSALYAMVTTKKGKNTKKTVNALTFRISLSVVLFILVIMAYATGLIKPEGIGVRMQQQRLMQSK
ncbi:MAG: twin transmembrane helix small protein [Methylococcales bacterium]|nr:twin transmembrane helix small protein [Methylococcales bacterium]